MRLSDQIASCATTARPSPLVSSKQGSSWSRRSSRKVNDQVRSSSETVGMISSSSGFRR